jgi:hypothetical protein
MDFLLDAERVLLAMITGATVLMVAAVRPSLPAESANEIGGAVWRRYNVGALIAVSLVVVLAAVRLADGDDQALVHVVGGLVMLVVLGLKSRQDGKIHAQIHSDAGEAAVQREVTRVVPMVVAMLVLSLALALGPA